ncbi:MAG: FG-GAP-like repeat-containing protein [Candidatus Omnitrophota bacterium]
MKTLKRLFVGGALFIGVSLILTNVAASSLQPSSTSATISIKKSHNEIQSNNEERWREVQKLLASDGAKDGYLGRSVSISGSWAIAGAAGAAYVFKYDGYKWIEEQKLVESDGASGGSFGYRVSMSGDRAIVGTRTRTSGRPGSAYIFKYDGVKWIEEQKIIATDGYEYDEFGRSVSISGEWVMVGAQYYDNGGYYGSAYMFKFNGTKWIQVQKIAQSWTSSFGRSVSISGNRAIIGALTADASYIFKYDGYKWIEEQKLVASDGDENDEFGRSVSISGDRAIVGRCDGKLEDAGVAYIFKYDGVKWIEEQKLLANDGSKGDSVSISGNWAIVGSSYEGHDWNGVIYIFKYDGVEWIQAQEFSPVSKAFGTSVSLSGNRAIVGAVFDHDSACNDGSAYIYELSPEGFSTASVVGESDPDSNLDIGTAFGTTDGKVYLYDSNGDILPNWPQKTDGESILNRPSIADIDGDGKKEIIASTEKGIYIWNKDGTLAPGWPYVESEDAEGSTDIIASSPIISDLEGDTKTEIIVSIYNPIRDSRSNIVGIKVFNNDGTIRVFNGSKYLFNETMRSTRRIFVEAVGDFEGDGNIEFLISEKFYECCPNAVSELRSLLADGTTIGGWGIEYWSVYDDDVTVKSCMGDIDRDGDLEIITVEFNKDVQKVSAHNYYGNLISGFPRDIPVSTPGSIYYDCSSPVLGDLDNDGDLEIVIYSMSDSSNPDYYISNVLAYHHDGTLVNGFPAEIKNWKNVYYPPVIADIDGDSNAEIVVILHEYIENEPNKAGVIAYHNDGSIVDGFPKYVSSEELTLVGNNENSLAVGDLDDDGDLEIVVAGYPDKLHIIPIEKTYNPSKLEWPQYKNNSRNTNCLTYTNKKPYFDPKISPVSIREMELLSFYIEAADVENDFIDITLVNQPDGSYFRNKGFLTKRVPGYSKARFSWRPQYGEAGDYNLTFKAADSLGDFTLMQVYVTVKKAPNAGTIRVSTLRPHMGSPNTFYPFSGVEAKINETGETAITSNGRYDFKDIPVGTYTVSVKVDGYIPRENNIKVTVEKGKSKTIVFKFERYVEVGGYVEGYVKEEGTGKIIKGATLYASSVDVIGTTDENGYYKIKLPEGSYSIRVSKGGYYTKFIGTPVITKDKTHDLGNVYLKKAPLIGVDVGDPSEDGGKGDNKRPATQSSIKVTPLRTVAVKLATSPISIATSAVTTAIKVSFQAVTSMFRIN